MNTIAKDFRLDNIVELLQKAKCVTIVELIQKTGKSRATIKRDLKILKKHFPQIKTKQGTGGGIFWEDKK